jgi:hypothetical protein
MSDYFFARVVGGDSHDKKKFLRVIQAQPVVGSIHDLSTSIDAAWRAYGGDGEFDAGPNYFTLTQVIEGVHAAPNFWSTNIAFDMTHMILSDMALLQAFHNYIDSTHTSFERILAMIFGDGDHPSKDPNKQWLVCGIDPTSTRPPEQLLFGGDCMVATGTTTAELYELCDSAHNFGVSIQRIPYT